MKAYFEILRKDEVRFRPEQNTMPWHDQPEGTAADKAAVEYAQAALLYRWSAMVIEGVFHCGDDKVPLTLESVTLAARLPGRYIDFSSLREIPEYEEASEAAEMHQLGKLIDEMQARGRPEDF